MDQPASTTGTQRTDARRRAQGAYDTLSKSFTVLACVLLAGACARTGDFGRLRQPPGHSPELRALGAYFGWRRNQPVSDYPYTDEEKDLRARAFAFLTPAGQTGMVGAIVAEWRIIHLVATRHPASDPAVYFRSLSRPQRTSTASLWMRIIADMRNDEATIEPFAKAAFQVANADRGRYGALRQQRRTGLDDVRNAYARLDENHRLVANVNLALRDRIAAYDYAIGKARLAVPDQREAEARFVLADLKREAGIVSEVLGYYEITEPRMPSKSDMAPIEIVPPPPIVDLSDS